MNNLPEPSSFILVAILPSQRDLDIARLLGWYRIPLKSAPKVVDVDYLAFYQTSAFGAEHRWQIEAFAEVRGHELTTRAELFHDEPDHPRAREEYFKVQIGPLQMLPSPILAGSWKRLTFLYTTGRQFVEAHTLNELVVRSEEREFLWRALRERAARAAEYRSENELPADFTLDPALLALLGGLDAVHEAPGTYTPDSW